MSDPEAKCSEPHHDEYNHKQLLSHEDRITQDWNWLSDIL